MVPESAIHLLSWIWLTHVGYPRAHCQEGVLHAASSDSDAGLTGGAVPEAVDEEVTQLGLLTDDVGEVRAFAVMGTEGTPLLEDFATGIACFLDSCSVGIPDRKAEVTCEIISDVGWRSCQGAGCG